jgi:hypothetical protein
MRQGLQRRDRRSAFGLRLLNQSATRTIARQGTATLTGLFVLFPIASRQPWPIATERSVSHGSVECRVW